MTGAVDCPESPVVGHRLADRVRYSGLLLKLAVVLITNWDGVILIDAFSSKTPKNKAFCNIATISEQSMRVNI